jgi:hypothetical protein
MWRRPITGGACLRWHRRQADLVEAGEALEVSSHLVLDGDGGLEHQQVIASNGEDLD